MLRFAITNMNCGGCAKSVRAVLGKVAPGAEVFVDLEHRQVTLVAAEAAPILAALLADGWKATAIPGQVSATFCLAAEMYRSRPCLRIVESTRDNTMKRKTFGVIAAIAFSGAATLTFAQAPQNSHGHATPPAGAAGRTGMPMMQGHGGAGHGGAGQGGAGHVAATAPANASPSTLAFVAANDRMHRDMAVTFSGNSDRDFAAAMIPHHQGAIDMARIALEHGRDPEVRALAQSIIRDQEREIAQMRVIIARIPAR